MTKVIVYASKYGTTKECAIKLSELMSDVDLLDVEKNEVDLSLYETVILGSSIYAGQIRPKMKEFVEGNFEELFKRSIGIFVCGANEEEVDKAVENNYGELASKAKSIAHFGYKYDFDKMKFFEKLIIKKIAKVKTSEKNIYQEKIQQFSKKF